MKGSYIIGVDNKIWNLQFKEQTIRYRSIGHQNIGTLNLYQCKPDGNTKISIINSNFVRAIHEVESSSSMDFINIQL
jgi:hypothetical protein